MEEKIFQKIKQKLPGIKTKVSLARHTTFRIGGRAQYFYKAKTKKDIIEAILTAKRLELPFFIFGGGSNLLVSDKGYKGLIIKIQNSKFKTQNSKIIAEAGVWLGQLIWKTLEKNLRGLEWATGIPGTVGGAIRGNAGAFGSSIADIVKEVEVFDIEKELTKNFSKKDCQFDYRESIFKKNPNLIILSAILQLKKGNKKEIEEKMKEILESRREKQPLKFFSAGSIFKNPPEVSAGELIEKCELKGKKIGEVKISEKHANFIINAGQGKAEDVMGLIKLIKKEVKNKFNIALEEEIQYLGDFSS